MPVLSVKNTPVPQKSSRRGASEVVCSDLCAATFFLCLFLSISIVHECSVAFHVDSLQLLLSPLGCRH